MTVTLTFCEPQGVLKTSVKLPRVLFNEETLNVLPLPVTPRLLGPLVNVTTPLGLTLKPIVPLLCFENESGLGLVVTCYNPEKDPDGAYGRRLGRFIESVVEANP